jgi:hypothetical protein
MSTISRWPSLLALALLYAVAMFGAPANAVGVAMVTDMQGQASLVGDAEKREIGILVELDAGATVMLAADARLVVLYLGSGDEYAFSGPVSIRFEAGAPATSGGAPGERRGPALGRNAGDVRIKPVRVELAAIVMRSASEGRSQPLAPAHTSILETRPEFVWTGPLAGLRYAFELYDGGGTQMVKTAVEATSLTLPAGVELALGGAYSWRVTARLPNGATYARNGEFRVASADLRAKAQALRPGGSAPLSSRVAYATWLEQNDLKAEARRYWRAAAMERPHDAQLKALAEE